MIGLSVPGFRHEGSPALGDAEFLEKIAVDYVVNRLEAEGMEFCSHLFEMINLVARKS
jgi:hypothetical protein